MSTPPMADETRDGVLGSIKSWFRALDRILRGEATSLPALREGHIRIPALGLSQIIIGLGAVYGLCMGAFALFNRGAGAEVQQLIASMVKVPLLFFLTLLVTFPSLYIFNALVGSRLTLTSLMRLMVAAIGVTVAVLASFGPIVVFFSLTTTSYPFMLLLNVLIFAVAGFLGLAFLLQTLHRLSLALADLGWAGAHHPMMRDVDPMAGASAADAPLPTPPPAAPAGAEPPLDAQLMPDDAPETPHAAGSPPVYRAAPVQPPPPWGRRAVPGALERLERHVLGRHTRLVFRIWMVVFALVGGQMSWVLRPFIGHPGQPFTWFRPRESNFFEAVWRALHHLLT